MRNLMIRADAARSALWGSCLTAALLAFSCSKSEADETSVQSAAVTSEPAPEVAPIATPAAVEAVPSAKPEAEAENSEGGTAEAEITNKESAAQKQDSAEAAKKPSPEKKNTAPAEETPKTAPKSESYTGPDPCRAKKFSFSSVKNACNKGGVSQTKELMKGFTKKGKDQGKKWKCSTCHDSTKTYTNKPNAVKDLKSIF